MSTNIVKFIIKKQTAIKYPKTNITLIVIDKHEGFLKGVLMNYVIQGVCSELIYMLHLYAFKHSSAQTICCM